MAAKKAPAKKPPTPPQKNKPEAKQSKSQVAATKKTVVEKAKRAAAAADKPAAQRYAKSKADSASMDAGMKYTSRSVAFPGMKPQPDFTEVSDAQFNKAVAAMNKAYNTTYKSAFSKAMGTAKKKKK